MRDIICIGASAGGVEALCAAVASFPPHLPASVFVVLHIPAYQTSELPAILTRAGQLPAKAARDSEQFKRGQIYVASPDHHLLLERGKVRVLKGPKENRSRPAIDPLFRSAAEHYPHRTVGILLSGLLDDGSAGLWALKRAGGITIIQDPRESLFPDMVLSAQRQIDVDHVSSAVQLGPLLMKLSRKPATQRQGSAEAATLTRLENRYAKMEPIPRERLAEIGTPSSLICPECAGPLWEIKRGPRRYRCHTGHTYTPNALLAAHRDVTERTLGMLMTMFDDEVNLIRHIAEAVDDPEQSKRAHQQLKESEARAKRLRKFLPGGFQQ